MVEIRWHGRGGQGAKTASQLLALAQMRAGLEVQAFPEYGPERTGAPMRAYNRADRRPIRRHDGVTRPDVAVVLDDSLLGEEAVAAGLGPGGLLLVNTRLGEEAVRRATGHTGPVACLDADGMGRAHGARYANPVLVGALAAHLGDVPLEELLAAASELWGGRLSGQALAANQAAAAAGFAWAEGRRWAWAG